jgi:UDP-N-acetylglucosamine 2-epimerase (non-hydrolysing)
MRVAQIHLVAGARPNFMKIAPLYHALKQRAWCKPVLVHSGQHYDLGMSDVFFRDLNLPVPDHALGIGGGSHGEQLGKVVMAYEKLLAQTRPDLVTVVGDVNATAACTLAAKKLNLPVAHVEAGLRSRDRTMPEEINRIVTDSICDLHLTPSRDADDNLRAENVPEACIHFVGNIMIDSLVALTPTVLARPHPFPQAGERYAIATFHRPANVDDPATLKVLVDGLLALSRTIPIVFPLHPRTRQRLQASGLLAALEGSGAVMLTEPLGYADFMRCLFGAAMVVTDSGGVQEETTYLGIPCFTARPSTERPITVTHGTNRLISLHDISALAVPGGQVQQPVPPPLWDGRTAVRIADVFERYLTAGAPLRQG